MNFKILKYEIVDDEILNAVNYYDSISPALGLTFEKNTEKALDELEKNPENYFNLEDKKHRRIIIEKFPYALIYCIEKDVVIVKMLFPLLKNPAKLWIGIR